MRTAIFVKLYFKTKIGMAGLILEPQPTLRRESIRTANKIVTILANLSPKYLCYRKYVLVSIKALCCGYLEPKKLRARPSNEAPTPS